MKDLANNFASMCFGETASVLYRNFQIYISAEMKSYGVNFSEYAYLLKIQEKEKVNQKYLAEITFTDNAIVTRSLQSLEKKKLIIRHKSSEDKREILINLTDEGRDVAIICRSLRKRWRGYVLQGTSDQDEALLFSYIKKITWNALKVNNPGIDL